VSDKFQQELRDVQTAMTSLDAKDAAWKLDGLENFKLFHHSTQDD